MRKVIPTKEIKIVPIGNFRGVRLPQRLLDKYAIVDTVVLEEREDGSFLRGGQATEKLSWEETFREMALEAEDWSDMEAASGDGIDDADEPWATSP
jgi:antitoxin MazE